MSAESFDFPWQYYFPPFFTLQPHSETRSRQLAIWRNVVLNFFRFSKQCTFDLREAWQLSLFNNRLINRKLNKDFIIAILSDLQRTGHAAAMDCEKNNWEIYWHTLDEFGSLIYAYVCSQGGLDMVFSIYELTNGEDVVDKEFCGLDGPIAIKALKILENQGKCELIICGDLSGVKFFNAGKCVGNK